MLRRIEVGSRLVFAAALAAILVWRPSPTAFGVGALMLLTLSWTSARHDELRSMAEEAEMDDRLLFLERVRRSARARVKNARLGLIAFGAGTILGPLLAHSLFAGGGLDKLLSNLEASVVHSSTGKLLLVLLGALFARLVQVYLARRTELRRVEALQHEYGEESRREAQAALERPA